MRLTFAGSAKALGAVLLLGWAAAQLAPHGVTQLFTSSEEYSATERVRRILEGSKPGGNVQSAICLWSTGTLISADAAFDVAEDRFNAWKAEKGIKSIAAFEILEARLETQEPHAPGTGVVVVAVRIDGREHVMRVPPGQPIRWLR